MWTCPKCGEPIEDQFTLCWKCAAPPEKSTRRPLFSRSARRYFLLGLLFELVLIALCFLLPECWLQIEVRNFTLVTHFPLMMLMIFLGGALGRNAGFAALLGLPICLAIMASIWGFLIYWFARLIKGVLGRLIVSPRQKLVVKCGAVFFVAAVLLWTIVANLPATPIPFTVTPEVQSTVDDNTAFALDLYHKLKDRPGNLFFSPYSISTSLAMTYAGARGQTETEMAKALHFHLAQTNLPVAFGELGARMSRIQRWNRITLKTANSLWCQKDYQFTDAFLNLVHKYYHAEARPVDFKNPTPTAAKEINDWVKSRTRGKIKGAVEPGQFTGLTRLVLCNAIYFKGKWQHQFKKSDTKPAPFHVTTNETVTVPMMRQEAHFKTVRYDDHSVALMELPYMGTDLSMIILLPEIEQLSPEAGQSGLPDLEQKLNADNLCAWLALLDQAKPYEIEIVLPRFTTTQSFNLTHELQSLGMTTAFNDHADFSGMDGTTNLFISDVIHQAFVEVNESGTEAAAITLGFVTLAGRPESFIVDRPFIFLIRENGSGSILFIGRTVDPTK